MANRSELGNQGVLRPGGLHSAMAPGELDGGTLANLSASRKVVIGVILVVALFAFEVFNFDTTRYALQYLLGEVTFWGMQWATILAVAFCAIDFAGLARLFTPEQGDEEPRMVWYLMGAWLLGATMNAVMTWWAVSLTLLSHDFGNEVLSREQLLQFVPIFVAALVWLTRILFIGALSVAGDHIFELSAGDAPAQSHSRQSQPAVSGGHLSLNSPGLKMARGAAGGAPGSIAPAGHPRPQPARRRPQPRSAPGNRSPLARDRSPLARDRSPVVGNRPQVRVGFQARDRRR